MNSGYSTKFYEIGNRAVPSANAICPQQKPKICRQKNFRNKKFKNNQFSAQKTKFTDFKTENAKPEIFQTAFAPV
ncbi:hypothetical protein [Neisseria polysaccharea]|uniref:hypothetical protein n=1 Tax=Neisseria polysaccharea TaxID=489 RepID=UPI0002E6473B|nr:hypothetical protein [Neisseria polysaccharea]